MYVREALYCRAYILFATTSGPLRGKPFHVGMATYGNAMREGRGYTIDRRVVPHRVDRPINTSTGAHFVGKVRRTCKAASGNTDGHSLARFSWWELSDLLGVADRDGETCLAPSELLDLISVHACCTLDIEPFYPGCMYFIFKC